MPGRVRRRVSVTERHQEPSKAQRAQWRLEQECSRSRLARCIDEGGLDSPHGRPFVDPVWRRSDQWWLTTPGIDPLVRYRELCWRGVWDWQRDAHRVPGRAVA